MANRTTESRALSWIFLQLLSLCISLCVYQWIFNYYSGYNFVPSFIVLLCAALVIVFIQKYLQGGKFWLELPTVTTFYILLALFIPTLYLYYSDILKVFLQWDDWTILKSCALGIIFIHFIWLSYAIVKVILPRLRNYGNNHRYGIHVVYILMAVSLLASFLAIVTGTFGVLQSTNLLVISNYIQYIDILQNMGVLALVLLTYYYPNRKLTIFCFTIILFVIGILSAQKQAALIPFFALFVAYYSSTGSIPKGWILLGVLAAYTAFSGVSLIRQFYFDKFTGGVSTVAEVASISKNALNATEFDKAYNTYDVSDQMLMRMFYGSSISKAIEYTGENGYGVPDDSKLSHVLLAPIYAIVPRLIFPEKPLSNFGNWFASNVVLKQPVRYGIGTTPVGYGYMVYGVWGVLLVALILGTFMAIMHNILFERYLIIYIFVYIRSVLPSDVTSEYISSSIKIILVTWLVLKILQMKWTVSEKRTPQIIPQPLG